MNIKKKLNLTKMNITQLSAVNGGDLENPFKDTHKKLPTEQPVGGGGVCYTDTPGSAIFCV